jgi:two-component system, NarL family, response regulator YdfI
MPNMTGETVPVSLSHARLSRREAEVLEMAARGLTNPEIASRMHVTVHTVKYHLAGIYRKLGVANRTEAAVAYLRSPQTELRPLADVDGRS